MRDKGEQNDWIIDQFIHRTPDSKNTISVLRSLPDIYRNGGDLVATELVRRLSMEFDWKRRPTSVGMRPIRGKDHLYFETAPWTSKKEFDECRAKWEQYQSTGPAVLKTERDLADFEEFRMLEIAGGSIKRSRRQPALTLARRMFLRAYVRSQWGLNSREMSYSELALWLTDNGYKTSKADVENAHRPSAKLVENAVPHSVQVNGFVLCVQERFPSFNCNLLYAKMP